MFLWPVRVYYEDTDSGGVVYYANYMKFMERARTEWLRSHGFEQDELVAREGIIFAVRAIHVEYLRPARFNDLLQVSVQLKDKRSASMQFFQQVTRTENSAPAGTNSPSGDVLCTGDVRLACLDASTLRPRRIPEQILTEIVCDN